MVRPLQKFLSAAILWVRFEGCGFEILRKGMALDGLYRLLIHGKPAFSGFV